MRLLSVLLAGFVPLIPAHATTLQRLSMDDMIQQSTAIVRAKVTASYGAFRGQSIYTFYQIQILEVVKSSGASAQQMEVAVPGGSAKGVRQMVAGAPALQTNAEYVLFLWTSRSGLTQVIGLSQGLFSALYDSAGNAILVRPAASETMLDANGNPVSDPAVKLRWSDLRSRIRQDLGAGK
jgi:hypothetical protein